MSQVGPQHRKAGKDSDAPVVVMQIGYIKSNGHRFQG